MYYNNVIELGRRYQGQNLQFVPTWCHGRKRKQKVQTTSTVDRRHSNQMSLFLSTSILLLSQYCCTEYIEAFTTQNIYYFRYNSQKRDTIRSSFNPFSPGRAPYKRKELFILFDQQTIDAERTKSLSYAQSSYEKDIVRLGRQRKTDAALQLFESIPSYPTIRQVNAVIDACARARPVRIEKALQILQQFCQSTSSSSLKSDVSDSDRLSNHKIEKKLQANVYTFGALMNAISNSGDVNTAVQYVTETMEKQYGVVPNDVVYNAAISTCAKSNPPRPDVAIKLLDQAKDRNIPLTVNGYNAACAAAASAANWQLAASILRRMNATTSSATGTLIPLPDSITYGTVMSACEKSYEWKTCLSYFDTMIDDAKLQPDRLSLTSALHACQQLGLAQRALTYLDMMKQQQVELDEQQKQQASSSYNNGWKRNVQRVGPDAVAYRLAISACARGKSYKEAINVLETYLNDPYQQRPDQDVIAFTAAIHACENAGAWKYAFILVDKLRKSGAVPNEVTFAAVINACATACAQIQQQQLLQQNLMDLSSATSLPSEILVSSGDLPEPQTKALQLLSVLRKDATVPNPNIQVYNAAIRVCAEAYDLSRAFQVFDILQKDKLRPTIVTYGTLMTACERVGSTKGMDKVFQLLRQQQQNDDEPIQANEIIYGAAISVCRKSSDPERAYKLLQKMIDDGLSPNIATFNTALSAQMTDSAKRNMDRAMQIYQLLLIQGQQQIEQNSKVLPTRQTYTLLIRGFNMNKQPQQAEMMLRVMKDNGYQPDVDLYTTTITEYERVGKPLLALRLMESMRKDGYDFYESSVLNDLFKKAVKLASALGRTWTPTNSTTTSFRSSSISDFEDEMIM
jgi:pentatricopeptide repeat domain-containing protein 1